ncbi:MAG TPA: hypothetical protein VFG47_11350 [Geminicoccaceae bacterium]|nr:hypothetical protein [Geminicoccaceae bacterium]
MADREQASGAACETVTWIGGPVDPLAYLAADRDVRVDRWDRWLLRRVDVRAAPAARGYPPHARRP